MKIKTLLFVVLFLNSFNSFSQKKKTTRIDNEFPTQTAFPNEFFADYKGNLSIYKGNDLTENYPMEVFFSPTSKKDTYRYTLIYFVNGLRQIRDYNIIQLNEEKGLYKIREENGLEFQALLINNSLRSSFQVADNVFYSEIDFSRKDKLIIKIVTSNKKIGLETISSDGKEKMNSYGIIITQIASLTKTYKD